MSTPFLNFSRIICTNFRQDHASGFWGAGLCGWNCRHTFFAVFPELGDPPAWTRDQLEELNARNIEYNGKRYTRYEINQMQRARERNVRRWKKRYLAETEAGVDTTDSAVRLKAARQSLSDFTKATGGRVDSARTSVPKFGRSEGSRANWAAKDYEKQQKDAIIIENLRTAAKLPKAAVIHLEPTKINVDALTFDDAHINAEREHRVSEEQAKQYIPRWVSPQLMATATRCKDFCLSLERSI